MNNPHHQFQIEMSCPHCSKHTDMFVHEVFDWKPQAEMEYDFFLNGPIESPKRIIKNTAQLKNQPNHLLQAGKDKITAYGISSCPKCCAPILLLFNSSTHNLRYLRNLSPNSLMANTAFAQKYIELLGTIPPAKNYSVPESLPEDIKALWRATQQSLDRGDPPSRIVSECRSILDVSLKELGQAKGPRKKRIENLKNGFVITNDIALWANELWDDGNDAVHDIKANGESARQHVEFLKLFFRIVFELPNEIQGKQIAPTSS